MTTSIDPDFVHELQVSVTPQTLYDFLSDLHRQAELHPLIESIDELPASPDQPRARRYRVVDRVPLGPFRLRTRYLAALDPVSEVEIRGFAWQFPAVRLRTVYELREVPGGTHLSERVHVSAPWGLRGFVIRQAQAAHGTTLARMKDLLEGADLSRARAPHPARGE